MIFLGAGASKVFGLKTMQDLTDDLVKKMREKGHGETIDDILEALRVYGLTPDFENIYTTLEALVNLKEGIKKSGAFTAYVAWESMSKDQEIRSMATMKQHPEFKTVLADLRDLIYNECSIPKGTIENNRSIFDQLSKATSNQSEKRVLSSKVGRNDSTQVHVGQTIVTTNYDVAVELYHRYAGKELADGFKSTQKEYTKELDLTEYGRKYGSQWLIKLHGSIWQFKQGDKIIQTIASPKNLPLRISVGEQMMIYPVGEKPILQEPYYSFYSIFKEQPWSALVTIGYSFRDEPINIAILERLEVPPPPKIKLIVVNPDAEKVIGNLGSKVSELNQRIIRISEPFQDDEKLFGKIRMAIESRDWNQFKRARQYW